MVMNQPNGSGLNRFRL